MPEAEKHMRCRDHGITEVTPDLERRVRSAIRAD